jgi:succinate-semialdehyde dehydrogenase/glutarate-semialdehyde dehydrogenase
MAMPDTSSGTLYIDGKWQPAASGRTFESTNPATSEVLAKVSDADTADVRAAISAAEAAFPAWSARTAYERADYLYKAYQLMTERLDDLARLMTTEQGKPLRTARIEAQYAADFLIWFAEEAKRVYGQTIPSHRPEQRFMVQHQAVGVVGAITPWNYPTSMLTRKLGPALAAGCTVVLKPAEQTPLCAIEIIKILHEVGVPAGVVNLVTTNTPSVVGDEFMTNPVVRKLAFTGSTEVGKMLAAGAASHIKRVSLELGGHAPFIAFPDVDPSRAATGAALVKFLNTGQACICPNRIYVHRSMIDKFVETLTGRVGRLKVGNGLEDGITTGPLIDEPAMAKMDRHVSDAVSKGATVALGGERLSGGAYDNGTFFAPTVLTDVTPDMLIYREETFGPIAGVIPFDDEEQVIQMANDTSYGLASYIYTNDLSRAFRVSEALRFAIIGINDINPTSAAAPFGGMKESGLGREGGQEGISEYLETKLVGISVAPAAR